MSSTGCLSAGKTCCNPRQDNPHRILPFQRTAKAERQKWRATHWNYSDLLTQMLRQSRFVMWYSEEKYGRFLPALYCLDRRTAVFAMRLAEPIRVCQKCETPFIPIAGNVDYCCIEHREAYRVARFRWRAKQRAEEAKKPVKKQRKARTR